MSWETDLLTALGIPVTQPNVSWLDNWMAAEAAGNSDMNYQAAPYNPFNIKIGGQFATFGSQSEGINATAYWLQHNGNFGSLGTYGQEIKAFLTGQSNNIASSLAWFSGHSGNPSGLTTSYQNLVGGSGSSSAANSSTGSIQSRILGSTKLTNQTQYATCNPWDVTCNTNNALLFMQNTMNNIQENIMDNLIVAAMAIVLLAVGVNWVSKQDVMQLQLPDTNGDGEEEQESKPEKEDKSSQGYKNKIEDISKRFNVQPSNVKKVVKDVPEDAAVA